MFQCDGKKMVRKTEFFGFCLEMPSFFYKVFCTRYVIGEYYV